MKLEDLNSVSNNYLPWTQLENILLRIISFVVTFCDYTWKFQKQQTNNGAFTRILHAYKTQRRKHCNAHKSAIKGDTIYLNMQNMSECRNNQTKSKETCKGKINTPIQWISNNKIFQIIQQRLQSIIFSTFIATIIYYVFVLLLTLRRGKLTHSLLIIYYITTFIFTVIFVCL